MIVRQGITMKYKRTALSSLIVLVVQLRMLHMQHVLV